jgi:hypothetical protein
MFVPKPEITIVEHVDKTRKCSYCNETRREKSRNGEILCPMMPKWHDIKHLYMLFYCNVFNNSYFWLWYSRLWTCDIFIVITKWSYFLIQIPLSHNSDGIDESITTRFISNRNSFSKESQYSLTKTRNAFIARRRDMKRAGKEKFFVQWCLSDMMLNICTCSFIVYTMSNSKTKDTEYQIFVNYLTNHTLQLI